MIARVSAPQLRDWWPLVASWIEASVRVSGRRSLAETRADVANGDATLWLIFGERLRAAAISLVAPSDAGPVLWWLHAGGSGASDWFDEMDATLEDEARRVGCVKMISLARPGWTTLARARGWSPRATLFDKDVAHG